MKWPPTSPPLALFDFISLWQLGMEGVVKVAMPAPFTAVVTSTTLLSVVWGRRRGLKFPFHASPATPKSRLRLSSVLRRDSAVGTQSGFTIILTPTRFRRRGDRIPKRTNETNQRTEWPLLDLLRRFEVTPKNIHNAIAPTHSDNNHSM